MKRSLTFFSAIMLLMFGMIQNSVAQSDDVYYDPNKDQGKQNNYQQNDNNSQNSQSNDQSNYSQPQQSDKTDGYGTPADKYDSRDNSNNNSSSYDNSSYATDAGYYDEDYDSYFYTTRLRRYYTPNYGTDYYSYYFTPAYYTGYNAWNTAYVVSYSPWYRDPWWRWNRRPAVVVYDPFYSPYWGWNFGWNSYSYYNSWSNPYWGYSSFGYGCGYGFGYGYGYGGYGYGGYGGYGYGGYYNGYNNGYYNGYHDGYYGSGANNGYYYNGPRHHHREDVIQQPGQGKIPVTNTASTPSIDKPGIAGGTHPTDIPKAGITKPFTPTYNNNTGGIKVDAGSEKPYVEKNSAENPGKPGVNIKPNDGNAGVHNNATGKWDSKDEKLNNFNGGSMQPKQNETGSSPNIGGMSGQPKSAEAKPLINQNAEPEGWHTAPPDRWTRKQERQQGQSEGNAQPRGNYSEPQHNNAAPQNHQPQQRSENTNWNRVEPRTNNEPRVQPQQSAPRPQQEYHQQNYNHVEQHSNFSAPQRSISPAPQHNSGGGGGGGSRGGRH